MTTFMKNGIEVCMPEDDEKSRQNMIIAAEFMARMIQKYGKKVLAKIEEKERLEANKESEDTIAE
jgi:aspartate/glutamate racemase